MRAMNATEVLAVFGGASGVDAPGVTGIHVDPSLYPQCPASPAPSEPEMWPGNLDA